jgi:hypothetical protein
VWLTEGDDGGGAPARFWRWQRHSDNGQEAMGSGGGARGLLKEEKWQGGREDKEQQRQHNGPFIEARWGQRGGGQVVRAATRRPRGCEGLAPTDG